MMDSVAEHYVTPKQELQHPVIAVMQPYFFPYLGYFQLISLADVFVVFDDVQFIRRGWINRNRLVVHGQPHWFTLPVRKMPRTARICDYQILVDVRWKRKFFGTLSAHYRKAPFFEPVMTLVEKIMNYGADNLVEFLMNHFAEILHYLGLQKKMVRSSELPYKRDADAQGKIISICHVLNAATYINPPGGQSLYHKEDFVREGFQLYFVFPELVPYPQNSHHFWPAMSIIDVLMWNSPERVLQFLQMFRLQ